MLHSLRRAAWLASGSLLGLLFCSSNLSAQGQDIEPASSVRIPMWIDSGAVENSSADPALQNSGVVIWSTVVSSPGHSSIRLHYEGVVLAGESAAPDPRGSYLRMTSLHDLGMQTQHTIHVSQWNNTSAYFNGSAVLVELVAFPGTGWNRFVLREVEAGVAPLEIDSICGATDDRTQSFDQRQGRNQPGGCTSWLIDDCSHCFLTAGHCSGSLQVVEFNVPLSNGNGSINHPSPSNQYAVDFASLQSNGGQGIGNDYAYFGVFPNSNTGLTPFEANGGQTYALAAAPPPVIGQNIRITGYGSTTSTSLPNSLNLVQKTHVGPYFSFLGTTVRHATDTTGGNSGSPIVLDGTNIAIGIHTHAGCDPANHGTASSLPALQAALANPHGVCVPPGLTFTIAGGEPLVVAPDGSTTIQVQVGADGSNTPQPGTGQLHVDTGTGFAVLAMSETSPNVYDATFPASTCGSSVSYFFSAMATSGDTHTFPRGGASESLVTPSGVALVSAVSFDFNAAVPWIVNNAGLTAGGWVRAVPVGNNGSRRDPVDDFDGSGSCWVTGNGNNADVDDGPTILITNILDLSAMSDPLVSYARWFMNDDGDDQWVTSISENGGATWAAIDTAQGDTSGWERQEFRILDFVTVLDQVRFRFSVGDVPNDSVTEGALDAFEVFEVLCNGAAAAWQQHGIGCAGTLGTPALDTVNVPRLGQNFTVAGSGMPFSGPVFGVFGFGGPTPIDLAPIGMIGCTLYPTTLITVALPNTLGLTSWTIPVPQDQALNGVDFVQQVLAVDPGANPLGLILTNAGVGTIGV